MQKVVMSMKILLVSNMYPSSDAPNYGVFVKNTEQILIESGFSVDRIVIHKTKNKIEKLFKYIGYYLRIISKAVSGEYELIYMHYASHNAIPLLIAKTLKKDLKLYSNVHGSDVVPESKFSFRLQKYVQKLLAVSDKVITPSNYYRNLVCEKYKLDRGRVYVFPSGGINNEVFHEIRDKAGLYTGLGLDEKVKYIGYAGRIDYKKGWDILLEAAYMLKKDGFLEDKKLIVVGSGKQDDIFNHKVKEYGLEGSIVRFNMLPQNRLNEVYNCLDVFCFPTMREGESLGLVGLEAMACGVPVIGSKMGGLLDYIIDNENGMFFEPGDSKMLKDKIVEYLSLSPEKRENMRRKALDTSCSYRVDAIKETLVHIFRY
jgi:glycosyltransferase involved in cell wall biosynthesis